MYGIFKHLPVMGLAAVFAVLSPRSIAAQETRTHDSTAHAAPQDTGAVSGYQGEQRAGDSAITDTSAAGDSLGQQDTTTSRLRPTDTTGAAAPSSGDSAMAGRDSSSVLPGDSSAIRPSSPSDRLNPTDSAGTSNPTQSP